VLENTGNQHTIKQMAVRRAQKTAQIDVMIKNLQGVKELKCNHPIFNPSPDYVINEGSLAIVIESQSAGGGMYVRSA
jgi:hypothetical protein